MPTILKRSGRTEPYDPVKIKNTLAAASDEAGRPLSASDLNSIVHELEALIQDKDQASTQQIYVVLVGILCVRGYAEILAKYMSYADNSFRR